MASSVTGCGGCIARHDPTVGLVITDVIMPGGMSGVDLAVTLSQERPELPVLLTTGYSEHVADAHGFPILQKPYDMDRLATALKTILNIDIPAD